MSLQLILNYIAFIAVVLACGFTLQRRYVLSLDHHDAWPRTRTYVQVSLSVQAMFFCYVAWVLFFGKHNVNHLEALAYVISAYVSGTMSLNIDRNVRRATAVEKSNGAGHRSSDKTRPRESRSFIEKEDRPQHH